MILKNELNNERLIFFFVQLGQQRSKGKIVKTKKFYLKQSQLNTD